MRFPVFCRGLYGISTDLGVDVMNNLTKLSRSLFLPKSFIQSDFEDQRRFKCTSAASRVSNSSEKLPVIRRGIQTLLAAARSCTSQALVFGNSKTFSLIIPPDGRCVYHVGLTSKTFDCGQGNTRISLVITLLGFFIKWD